MAKAFSLGYEGKAIWLAAGSPEDFKQITEALSELFGKVELGVDFPGDT